MGKEGAIRTEVWGKGKVTVQREGRERDSAFPLIGNQWRVEWEPLRQGRKERRERERKKIDCAALIPRRSRNGWRHRAWAGVGAHVMCGGEAGGRRQP